MKFTILKRLAFGYLIIMLLVIFMGLYVTMKLNHLNRMIRDIAAVDVFTVRGIEVMLEILLSQVHFEKKYVISKDPDFYLQFHKTREHFEKNTKQLETLLGDSDKRIMLLGAKALYNRYLSLFEEQSLLIKKGESDPGQQFLVEREQIIDRINQIMRKIIIMARRDRDNKIASSNRFSYRVFRVSALTAILIVFMGVFITLLNTRTINRSIMLLKRKTKEIAAGRFVEIHEVSSPPEIKELADDFNTMSKRLKELDEMKLDFISHVSHELKTPLTAIREASSMLLEKRVAHSPEKQQELLTITKEECERLIEAVNKILDLSRMDAKMMEYRFNVCSLVPVLQKTVLKLAPIVHSKKIDLVLKPLPRLPLANMDEERIGHVLENLLDNALKYTPEKGAIAVEATLQKKDKKTILVSVSDTGIGIDEENLGKIFDKFKRMDHGKKTAKGTGLGLSIARHIITDHGGKIWVESKPGKGSTFYFTLPVF